LAAFFPLDFFVVDFVVVVAVTAVSCIAGAVELAVMADVVSIAAADVSTAELSFFAQPPRTAAAIISVETAPTFFVICCTFPPC